jgi:hypothetical protein
MHARDVATAIISVCSGLWRLNSEKYMARAGTMTMPPPIPSKPARKPLLIPKPRQKTIKNIVSKETVFSVNSRTT